MVDRRISRLFALLTRPRSEVDTSGARRPLLRRALPIVVAGLGLAATLFFWGAVIAPDARELQRTFLEGCEPFAGAADSGEVAAAHFRCCVHGA